MSAPRCSHCLQPLPAPGWSSWYAGPDGLVFCDIACQGAYQRAHPELVAPMTIRPVRA